eukprot:4082554-Pleurochrysis_carterae.AAC.1
MPCLADPKTRKKALLDVDHAGWTAAERAEIDNHRSSGRWTVVDRSQVPTSHSIVRLIWAYKRI